MSHTCDSSLSLSTFKSIWREFSIAWCTEATWKKKIWKWFSKAFALKMKNIQSLCGYQTSHFSHTYIHSFIHEDALNVSFVKCETLFNDKITSIFHTFKKEHEWVSKRHDTSLSIAWHCEYYRLKWAFIAFKGISSYAWWNFFLRRKKIISVFFFFRKYSWSKTQLSIEFELLNQIDIKFGWN